MNSQSRRGFVKSMSILPVVGLSGCARFAHSDSNTTNNSPEYYRLNNTAIYIADGVGLRLPEEANRMYRPESAELLILHGNLSVTPDQVVEWLREGRIIALLGERAESSWFDVIQSEAYREAFPTGGAGDADPDPQLLVAVAFGNRTDTYRKTWGNQPDNDELLVALDERVTEIESRRGTKTE
jgi:hypothetical protein